MSEETQKLKMQPEESPQEDEEDEGEELEEESGAQNQIIQMGSVTPTKGKHVIHCLTIVGQVEGHYILPPQNKTTKYEHVIPQLVAIQENPEIEGLIIILNTVGGDVEAGLAIAELVSGMNKPTVSLVLGGGHSIGVPLAVSARQSFIVSSATMTIHPVRMNGVVLGVPQTLSYFDKMQDRIVRFVEENSHITSEKFRQLMMKTGELVMDVGTVLHGQEAVDEGLIDHLGGLSDAIQCLYDMIEREKPPKDEGEDAKPFANADAFGSPLAAMYACRPRRKVKPSVRMPASRRSPPPKTVVCGGNDRIRHGAHLDGNTIDPEPSGSRAAAKVPTGGGKKNRVNPFGHPAPYVD